MPNGQRLSTKTVSARACSALATNPPSDRLTTDGAEKRDNGYGDGHLGKSGETLGAFTLIHARNYNNKRATASLVIFGL